MLLSKYPQRQLGDSFRFSLITFTQIPFHQRRSHFAVGSRISRRLPKLINLFFDQHGREPLDHPMLRIVHQRERTNFDAHLRDGSHHYEFVKAKVDPLWPSSAYAGTCGEVTTALMKWFLRKAD